MKIQDRLGTDILGYCKFNYKGYEIIATTIVCIKEVAVYESPDIAIGFFHTVQEAIEHIDQTVQNELPIQDSVVSKLKDIIDEISRKGLR